jgi:outer membrane protein TolC
MTARYVATIALLLSAASPVVAQAQGGGGPPARFFGSVPQGTPDAQPLALTLKDTVARALQFNLGVLLEEESARSAHGARWIALADLLPRVSASVSELRQVLNLEAFGFPSPDPIVGPFNVFDARLRLSQPVVDLRAWHEAKAASSTERAAALGIRTARELVILISVDLYLEVVTAESRIDVAKAQLETATALSKQASDLKAGGLVAGIDVLRADAQVQNQRQRRIVAENAFEKAKLRLARAIGLPPGQAITLTDKIPYAPLDGVSVDQALAGAYAQRADYLAARERLSAAEAGQRAATAELLPSFKIDADYGTIGQVTTAAHPTYTVAASVRVPVFDGGRTQGRRIEAASLLRQRQAEYDDLRGRIDLDVRSSILDLTAATEQLDASRTSVSLANQELTQARDRFAAGVAGNLEVTQAQESVASASDRYIAALYNHNVAKATLARAVGTAEQAVTSFLGGIK